MIKTYIFEPPPPASAPSPTDLSTPHLLHAMRLNNKDNYFIYVYLCCAGQKILSHYLTILHVIKTDFSVCAEKPLFVRSANLAVSRILAIKELTFFYGILIFLRNYYKCLDRQNTLSIRGLYICKYIHKKCHRICIEGLFFIYVTNQIPLDIKMRF